MVDCNGLSPVYQAVKVNMKSLCTDPFARGEYGPKRFYDNGKYIGHDEPSVKFISPARGSVNHMTYLMQLAGRPRGHADTRRFTKYAELSIAPWFGLPLCDPKSYPQQTQYCVALTIDSLACSFNFKFCNNNCIEPVNFATCSRARPSGPTPGKASNG